MKIAYQAILEPQEPRGFVVSFPDFEETHTEGDNWEDAIFNATEALDLTLEARMEYGRNIPEPKEHTGGISIIPSAPVQAAILMQKARGSRSLSELARALGTSWTSAQRIEDPTNSTTLKRLDRAAAALGYRLVIELAPIRESQELEQNAANL